MATNCTVIIVMNDGKKKKFSTTAEELFRSIRYDGGKIKKFLTKKTIET